MDVVVPLRPEFAATLRTVAVSLGADAGFSIDELDDLRLGVSELFTALVGDGLIGDGSEGSARGTFTIVPGALTVSISSDDGSVDLDLDDLALSILQSVSDSVDTTPTSVTLVKRASETSSAS